MISNCLFLACRSAALAQQLKISARHGMLTGLKPIEHASVRQKVGEPIEQLVEDQTVSAALALVRLLLAKPILKVEPGR